MTNPSPISPEGKSHEVELRERVAELEEALRELMDCRGIALPEPMCRDCADGGGICDNSMSRQKPCDQSVLEDWAQGVYRRAASLILGGRWQDISAAPRDGTPLRVRHPDGTEETGVYWSDTRYCMLGAPQGSRGPGWVSTEAGNLPIDPPTHWCRAASLLSDPPDSDRTPEQTAAMDELLQQDGELYDETDPEPSVVERVTDAVGQVFVDRTKQPQKSGGHGNVFPNGTGAHARCVGPIRCPECRAEAEQLARAAIAALTPPTRT
jgi:hypothetical protein